MRPLTTLLFKVGSQENTARCFFPVLVGINILCYCSYAVVSSAAFQRNINVVLTLAVTKVEYFKLKCFIPLLFNFVKQIRFL